MILFGETIIDCFADGTTTLGGAPMNVAWHLKGFGLEPKLITRIGDDRYGDFILERMQAWKMTTRAVQLDRHLPTGHCQVILSPTGEPTFRADTNQAYDHIEVGAALSEVPDGAAFYHGTLAIRGGVSRATLQTILAQRQLKRFCDVNLRPPHTPLDLARELIRGADFLKVNDFEFTSLTGKSVANASATTLRDHFNVKHLWITQQDRQVLYFSEQNQLNQTPPKAEGYCDSVGAGDAFCAALLFGMQHKWPPELQLQRANAFASAICEIRGAVATDLDFYHGFLQRWQTADCDI